jgi:hypothetical protein
MDRRRRERGEWEMEKKEELGEVQIMVDDAWRLRESVWENGRYGDMGLEWTWQGSKRLGWTDKEWR